MNYFEQKAEAEKLFTHYQKLAPFDPDLVIDDYPDEWEYHWSFFMNDYNGEFIRGSIPMWNTWWQASDGFVEFLDRHEEEVAKLGFVLIYHNDNLWGLGIDSAGHDFFEAYWIPLAKLYGLIEED